HGVGRTGKKCCKRYQKRCIHVGLNAESPIELDNLLQITSRLSSEIDSVAGFRILPELSE
ncbi:BnaA01g35620D, partial [Brassica napus]